MKVILTWNRSILISVFRMIDIAGVSTHGDLTYGMSTNLVPALAQMSTEIIVVCLPQLCPAFEMVLSSKFTRISTRRCTNAQINIRNIWDTFIPRMTREASISVATKIETGNASTEVSAPFRDGQRKPWAPTFGVVGPLTMHMQHTVLYRQGPPRAMGCCCLRVQDIKEARVGADGLFETRYLPSSFGMASPGTSYLTY